MNVKKEEYTFSVQLCLIEEKKVILNNQRGFIEKESELNEQVEINGTESGTKNASENVVMETFNFDIHQINFHFPSFLIFNEKK